MTVNLCRLELACAENALRGCVPLVAAGYGCLSAGSIAILAKCSSETGKVLLRFQGRRINLTNCHALPSPTAQACGDGVLAQYLADARFVDGCVQDSSLPWF